MNLFSPNLQMRKWQTFLSVLAAIFLSFSNFAYAAVDIKISSLTSTQTVTQGTSITLKATVTGSATLKYQWYKDGNQLSGKTSLKLYLSSFSSSNAGVYQLRVKNSTGTKWSAKFTLYYKSSGTTSGSTGSTTGTGKATISWVQPSKREDGSKLYFSDIGSYRVYHTNDSGSINKVYKVSSSNTQLALSSLPSGKHYFMLSTVDTSGAESKSTNIYSKSIP